MSHLAGLFGRAKPITAPGRIEGCLRERQRSPVFDPWTVTALAVAWLSLFVVLATDWSINPQYSYGWFVPLLTLAILWPRWQSRPSAEPAEWGRAMWWFGGLVLFAGLPIRLVEEANPEWRLILWLHAAWVVILSFHVIHHVGGWPWVRQMAFVVFFPLASVPLPVRVEQALIQGLAHGVTTLAVEAANWMGLAAYQHGNVVEIGSGVLGVEEACSGIRSLQASFLVALFLGEHYQFASGRRWVLLVAGWGMAILSNAARTYALIGVAVKHGLAEADRRHDHFATMALLGAMIGLVLIARLLQGRRASPTASAGTEARLEQRREGRAFPRGPAVVALGWFAAVALGVETWYRMHEREAGWNERWSIRRPVSGSPWTSVEIPEKTRSILRYSSGHSMTWRDASQFRWKLYYLRWEPGRNSAQLAKAHTPEICLSGAGGVLREMAGEHRLTTGTGEVPFRHYVFEFSGEPLHVFYCLWEDRPSQVSAPEDGSQRSRLWATWHGRRHLGQTVVELALRGPRTAEEARTALTQEWRGLWEQSDRGNQP